PVLGLRPDDLGFAGLRAGRRRGVAHGDGLPLGRRHLPLHSRDGRIVAVDPLQPGVELERIDHAAPLPAVVQETEPLGGLIPLTQEAEPFELQLALVEGLPGPLAEGLEFPVESMEYSGHCTLTVTVVRI